MGNTVTAPETTLPEMNVRNGDITTSTHNDAVSFLMNRGYKGDFRKIQLILSAENLRYGREFLSKCKCNPIAVVYKITDADTLEEIGRTEVRMNSRNPVWMDNIFSFHMIRRGADTLVFRVYHVDEEDFRLSGDVYSSFSTSEMLKLKEKNLIGEATCVQLELFEPPRRLCSELSLQKTQGRGTLTVRLEETVAAKQVVKMGLRCSEFKNKGFKSTRGHFLRILRSKNGVESVDTTIHETEVVMEDSNPTWKPIRLTTQSYQSKETHLVIECVEANSNGRSQAIIGKLDTSVTKLKTLRDGSVGQDFSIPSPHQDPLKKPTAQLFVDNFVETTLLRFSNYIKKESELKFIVAIDFAASNGDPSLPTSLHYINPSRKKNAYQEALFEVGNVIESFKSDSCIHVWGFGGIPVGNVGSDWFDSNGSASETKVKGCKGILSAYSRAVQEIRHGSSPAATFGQIITKASRLPGDQTKYSVLVIITAGVPADIQDSIDAVVGASDCPLSIVIVGLGGADFENMKLLDANNRSGPLRSGTGNKAERGIVQFIPWCQLQGGQISIVNKLFDEFAQQLSTYCGNKEK
ncbi:protein BONZAI 1-like [Papaver somniferum]|uniref:protein BONZAI 1-like n=1 Tax=Papaver somniferum TaxID=3469 RepID=UPI000E704490|nr:protein BONZAI 1-like [Papaver somniferum]